MKVERLVQDQLAKAKDATLPGRIRKFLVPPYAVELGWEYGRPGQKYVCWTVLEHRRSNTGIVYCEEGFGPSHPWGLVFLSGPHAGIGMDSGWYDSLEEAIVDSSASDDAGA